MTRSDGEPFDSLQHAASLGGLALPARQILVDRFFLHRRLGAGGFGVVYEAEDLRDGGFIALKVLNDRRAEWLYRFKREFRALQELSHANLVVLYELFGDEDTWFFTMELVNGIDFVRYVRGDSVGSTEPVVSSSGVCPLDETAQAPPALVGLRHADSTFHEGKLRRVMSQLLEGLCALHAANKGHRDIKPSNVLVDRAGRVVLIDFGLIRDGQQTTTGHAVVGTPAYMAPEQAASGQVAASADLYAVGVMLYEALTGVRPIDGTPLRILIDKQTATVKAPNAVVSNVPDDLNELCLQLLERDPANRPSAARALLALDTTTEFNSPSGVQDTTTFLGRDAELEVLCAAFAQIERGRPRALLLCGESGIGKSRLLGAFTATLQKEHPQAVFLEGKCYEREAIPYKTLDGIVEALTRHLLRLPSGEVSAILPTRRKMLARIFPALLRIPALAAQCGSPEEVLGSEGNLRDRAFGELRELFTRLAMMHPTVLSIDDLQWADEDGLRALAEIVRQPDAPALLLLGTFRTSRASADLTSERLRAIFPGDLRELHLAPLSDETAAELARALLGQAGAKEVDVRGIAREACGHPLFVEELARHAAARASTRSATLDEMICERIARLEPRVRELAELVAVAGKPLPKHVAAAAAQLESPVFQRSVATLRACRIVRTSSVRSADALEPYHDRVREAVVSELDSARRAHLHRCLARAFEASQSSDPDGLATHFREAGDDLHAGGYAVAAGDQAARAFAFEQAASWFKQALALLPDNDARRRELQIKLADALALAGRGALAAPYFLAAAETADVNASVELRRRAAEQLLRSGHFDSGVDASRSVLEAIGMHIPSTRFGILLSVVFYGILLRLRGFRFRERPEASISAAARTRIDACMSMAVALGFVDPIVGLVFQRRALLLALRAGYVERVGRLVAMEAAYLGVLGSRQRRRADALLALSRTLVARSGSAAGSAYAEGMAGITDFVSGRFMTAARHLSSCFELTEDSSLGLIFERVTCRMFLVRALAFLGNFTELCHCQREGLREALTRGDVYAAVNMRVGFANLAYLISDRPDVAKHELQKAQADWSTRGFHVEHFNLLLARVWNHLYVGEVESALEQADELLRRNRASLLWRMHLYRIWSRYARGGAALALVEQGSARREDLLRQAALDARGIERESLTPFRPLARVLRAGIALARGERARALDELTLVEREFAQADMSAYAAAAADRRARLLADGSTAHELNRVEALLRAQSVVAPQRLIGVLVPGLRGRGSVASEPGRLV